MKVGTEHMLGTGFLILVNKCLPHDGIKDEGSFFLNSDLCLWTKGHEVIFIIYKRMPITGQRIKKKINTDTWDRFSLPKLPRQITRVL